MRGISGYVVVFACFAGGCFPPALERPDADAETDDSIETHDSQELEDIATADEGVSLDVSPEEDSGGEVEVPDVVEPRCEPACANEGRCAEGNVCDCEGTGFGGPTCQQLVCGEVACPTLQGYEPSCSVLGFCEFSRVTEVPWHRDDVWIFVPPGSFLMGTPEGQLVGRADERPQHTVSFEKGFFVQKFEVTVRAYEACELDGVCSAPAVTDGDPGEWGVNRTEQGRTDHPQNGLSWAQAGDVCRWLGGRRLSEAEWEFAANGPGPRRRYPWGDEPGADCRVAVIGSMNVGFGCGRGGTWPVGSKPDGASGVGALDMAGNVAEWVTDCYHATYEGAPSDGTSWTPCLSVQPRVHRGGHYAMSVTVGLTQFRVSDRGSSGQADQRATHGARCAKSVQ